MKKILLGLFLAINCTLIAPSVSAIGNSSEPTPVISNSVDKCPEAHIISNRVNKCPEAHIISNRVNKCPETHIVSNSVGKCAETHFELIYYFEFEGTLILIYQWSCD